MKWNAFEFITPSFEKAKKRVLPFKFKEWLKLGIISSLASGNGFSGNSSGFNNSSGSSSDVSFEQVKQKLKQIIQDYWVIGAFIIGFFFLLGLILSYITSVFNFIFIESVLGKEAKFTFRKNNDKGISLFLFRLIFSIISFVVFIVLAIPYIRAFLNGEAIIQSVGVGYIVFSISFFILTILILWFLQLFVVDFVTAYMYSKNVSAGYAWRQIWKIVKQNKKESFVYWLARVVTNLITSIIGGVIIMIIALALIVIGLIIFLIGLGLSSIIAHGVLIALGIIIGAILLILLILAGLTVAGPLGVFTKYFHLLNFEKLTGIKILR